jgi:chromosome segregation ATPase
MAKQEADTRREVTSKDLETIDQAINDHETFQKDLFVLRRVLGEIGKLDQVCRGLKQAIEQVQAEAERTSSGLEQAKAGLAATQRQEVEKRQEVAELDAEIKRKQQTLEHYSKAIERITGVAA